MKIKRTIFIPLLSLSLLPLTPVATAAPAPFTIVESESQITLSGNVAGFNVTQQGPGSLSTRYTGTIMADVTASTIQFTGGTAIDAKTNGNWQPRPGGASGSAPADYAGRATGFVTLLGAFRDIVLDVTSPQLNLNLNKYGYSFDAGALVFGFPANSTAGVDYASALASGNKKFGGLFTNKVSLTGSLTQSAGVQRLVIAVDTEFKFRLLADNDSTVHLTGQLVAIREVGPAGPVFTSVGFSGQTVTMQIEGTGAQPILESSSDLLNWSPHSATVEINGTTRTYSVQVQGALEFFRLRQ